MDAWVTVLVMDVWHWTSLVALLCYSGLRAIPDVYYQAARIDRASNWAVFRHIQLPKMKSVLLIAVMLRFMDSFMIYTEPFVVTGGGPGHSTTFISIELVKIGDLVRGYDEHTLEPLTALVTCTFVYEDRDLYQFTTQAGTIVASHDHRPWRKRAWEGPEPLGHYPPLRAFVPGDITLWEVDGALVETEVLAVEPLGRTERVYHLTMAEGHMYVAGSLPAHNIQDKIMTMDANLT